MITGQAAAEALRLAVRLEAADPVDVTPPDPRSNDEAAATVDRLGRDRIPIADLTAIADEVGVGPETLRLALMEIAAGGHVPESAATIALSRRLTSDWLTDWELSNRLRALGLERVSLHRDGAGSMLVSRFVMEGFSRSFLGGVAGAAQRWGWPRLLAIMRSAPGGGSEVVFQMPLPGETPAQRQRLLGRAALRAALTGAVAAAAAALYSGAAAAGVGLLAFTATLYAVIGRRPSAEIARAQLEERLKGFLQGLE